RGRLPVFNPCVSTPSIVFSYYCNDRMYAMIPALSCSRINVLSNVGMIGSNPFTTLAFGLSSDSRTYASSTVTVPPPSNCSVLPQIPFQLGPLLLLPSTVWQELQPFRSYCNLPQSFG